MTPDEIALVQQSFNQVKPIADTAAGLFYQRLFVLDPSLRGLFKGDMQEQGQKLMQMLAVVVTGLTWLDTLLPTVQALGQRHHGYGATSEHYDTVGSALLWTLGQGLGEAFTSEVRAAWTNAYTLLASAMQQPVALAVSL